MLALLIFLAAGLGFAQRVLFVETEEGYELTAAQNLAYGSKNASDSLRLHYVNSGVSDYHHKDRMVQHDHGRLCELRRDHPF